MDGFGDQYVEISGSRFGNRGDAKARVPPLLVKLNFLHQKKKLPNLGLLFSPQILIAIKQLKSRISLI